MRIDGGWDGRRVGGVKWSKWGLRKERVWLEGDGDNAS